MSFAGTIRARPLGFLFGLAAVSLAALLLVPPIPQSQIYHGFADQQTLLGIPNFWNVVSNLPFILVGVLGLANANVRRELSATVFFAGVFLTGFSSSYYHWQPNDWGLFWDRMPMSVAFMAILANVIGERIDERVGKLLLWPLVALGVVSLLIWLSIDDLRLYGWVQFFPCVVLPVIFLAVPAEVHRHELLARRRGLLFPGQAAGALRRGDRCGARLQRPSAQARRRGRRLLRDLSGVPRPEADARSRPGPLRGCLGCLSENRFTRVGIMPQRLMPFLRSTSWNAVMIWA